jgi:hypothetical protein
MTGTTIHNALATIREVVAIAEVGRKAMCMISLDFKGAFDAISHEFMEEVLLKYGYSTRMVRRIIGLYEGTTSSIQMNGHIFTPIGIHASVRQGCPLCMLLYAQVLNPLLEALHYKFPGVRIGRRINHTSVAAYPDDVTVFFTSQDDIPTTCEVLTSYEKATSAKINKAKSRIMALGN